jgi:hypothetical protein
MESKTKWRRLTQVTPGIVKTLAYIAVFVDHAMKIIG